MTQQPDRDDDGYYHVDGNALPSVTTILGQELDKPGLEAWKQRTDNWREVRDRAALVGTLAHRRVLNQFAVRDLPLEEVPMGDVDGGMITDVETAEALWEDVRDEIPIDGAPFVEETLWSTEYGYAGTADMVTDDVVVDLKTSSGIRSSHKLQAAAYAHACGERDVADVNRAAIVKLNYREPAAGVTWLDSGQLDALFERYIELVESFHEQSRLAGPGKV